MNTMALEIDPQYKKFYLLDHKRGSITQFTCPVEGCDWRTDQGPGALRMHLMLKADPNCKGGYCKEHEAFVKANPDTVGLNWVHYLSKFPSASHGDTEIGKVKE